MKKIICLTSLILASSVYAQNKPVSFSTDSRIKHVTYQENNVIPVHGFPFISTEFQFGQSEKVIDIEGGDSVAWMVTYHPILPNIVFIKPTLFDSNSNLTIITNLHAYYFHLTSHQTFKYKSGQKTYALKFTYPDLNLKKKKAAHSLSKSTTLNHPKVVNSTYRFSGSPQLVPKHVFDDGKFTYFELSAQGIVPAIFAVDDQSGKESTVNTRRSGKYIIVQRIAPQFTLRQGGFATSVFNAKEIARIAANRRPQ